MGDSEDNTPRGGSVEPPGQGTQNARHASGSVATDITSASGTSSISMSDDSSIASFLYQLPSPPINGRGNGTSNGTHAQKVSVEDQITAHNKATILNFLSLAFVIRRDLGDELVASKIHSHIANYDDQEQADALVDAEQQVIEMKRLSGMNLPGPL